MYKGSTCPRDVWNVLNKSCVYILLLQMLWKFHIFLEHLNKHMSFFLVILVLADLKSDGLENSAVSSAMYLHSRVTSLDLDIGPNYFL